MRGKINDQVVLLDLPCRGLSSAIDAWRINGSAGWLEAVRLDPRLLRWKAPNNCNPQSLSIRKDECTFNNIQKIDGWTIMVDGLWYTGSYLRECKRDYGGGLQYSQSFPMGRQIVVVRGCNCRLYTFSFLWPLLELLLQRRRGIIITITGERDDARTPFLTAIIWYSRGAVEIYSTLLGHGYMEECNVFGIYKEYICTYLYE